MPNHSIDKKIRVIPHQYNSISVSAKTFTPDQKRVIVHAIGKWTNEVTFYF